MLGTTQVFLEVLHLADDQVLLGNECFDHLSLLVDDFDCDQLRTLLIFNFLIRDLAIRLFMGCLSGLWLLFRGSDLLALNLASLEG